MFKIFENSPKCGVITRLSKLLFKNDKLASPSASKTIGLSIVLTNLETNKLYKESEELNNIKDELKNLLNNRNELLKLIIKEFIDIKKKFGSSRKTKLIEGGDL